MSRVTDKIKTLVLTLRYPHRVSYYDDWAEAFSNAPCFDTDSRNLIGLGEKELARLLRNYELVVLLHACTGDSVSDLSRVASALGDRKRSHLLAFVGNEFNSPLAPLAEKLAVLEQCRPDVIATQLLEDAGRYLYDGLAARVVSIPHALNPARFVPGKPHRERNIDIGVRGYRYPGFIGDAERNVLIEYFRQHATEHALEADIETDQRLSPREWARFLGSCCGTVSSEAGSWYLQRDDRIVTAIKTFAESGRSGIVLGYSNPARSFVRRLPSPIKTWLAHVLHHGPVKYAGFEDARLEFDELYERFFKNEQRCPAYSKAISSRHLEAAGTLTCQLLMRGRYNDILEADVHYIPIAHDLSDVDTAIIRFKDDDERNRVASQAYDHVISAHTYTHRIAEIVSVVEAL